MEESQIMDNTPDFIPDTQFQPDQQPQTAPAETPKNPISDKAPDFIPDEQFNADEDKYGSTGQQAISALEGIGKGTIGPLATIAEKALGVNPLDIRMREKTNPIIHGISEAGALVGGMLTGTGEAAVLEGAGKAATKLLPAMQGTRAVSMGTSALKNAVEMLGFGAGDELSKFVLEDPEQSTQSAIAHIGLSGLLGAGGGALFGAAFPKWVETNGPAVDQGLQNFKNSVTGAVPDLKESSPIKEIEQAGLFGKLKKLKPEADQIQKSAEQNNWPVLEGMISNSKEVQMAEDALLNGPPTIASIGRRQQYEEAYNKVGDSVKNSTMSLTKGSETETGNTIKQGLLNRLQETYKPIQDMYDEIEPYRQAIPIGEKSTSKIFGNVMKAADELGLKPGTPRYNYFVTHGDISNVDNLQKLAVARTEMSKSAGPDTKDLAGILKSKFDDLEDSAIKGFGNKMATSEAKDKIMSLIDKSDMAKKSYAQFRETLQNLGNSLGKKKIYGPQNFMDFLDELNPQTLAKKTFNENNTEFASYLAKEFPDEFNVIRDYQRGLNIKGSAGEDLGTKAIVKNISTMQPEMQKLLYAQPELRTIKDAKLYLDSMPKSFNPSGTAHESAFRAFFEHPTGAAIANVRDYGIQSFIKAVGASYPGAEKKAGQLLSILGNKVLEKEPNSAAFKNSVTTAMSAMKASETLTKATTALFSGDSLNNIIPDKKDAHEKLSAKIDQISQTPGVMFSMGKDLGHYMPDHAQGLSMTAMNAVTLLNQMKPKPIQLSPLDAKINPTKAQEMAYDRILGIANNPLSILKHIQKGTLLPSDVKTIHDLYPKYYQKMSQQLTNSMMNHVSKDGTVPYHTRQSLSLFLGQPLDSTFTPSSIMAAQAAYMSKQEGPQNLPVTKNQKNTSKLGKFADNLYTQTQGAEQRRVSRK